MGLCCLCILQMKPVKDFETSAKGNNQHFKNYFHGMLEHGVYLPPSAFESYFLNDALSYEDLDKTIGSFGENCQSDLIFTF